MKPAIEVLEIPREELDALLEHARTALPEEDYRRLKAVVEGLSYLTELIADKDTTIRDLRQLVFPLLTEKTREVLKRAGIEETQQPAAASDSRQGQAEEAWPWTERRRCLSRCATDRDPAPRVAPGRSVSGLRQGQHLCAARAETAVADQRPGAVDCHGVRTRASALQLVR